MNLWVALLTGLGSGLSPCMLPTALMIVAYVAGSPGHSKLRGFYLSLWFVLGITLTLAVLGMAAGYVGTFILNLPFVDYVLAALVIFMGLIMLKVIPLNFTGNYWFQPKRGSGALGAFLLGIPFGIIGSPCMLPIVMSVLIYVAGTGSPILGFVMLLFFGIGRSVPVLIIGTFSGFIKTIQKWGNWQKYLETVAGILMLFIGVYLIFSA